jgi:DNA adenine methylase
MRYLGGKTRLSKYILPYILKNRLQNQYYVEPFAGAMNCIANVSGNRIASDICPYITALFFKCLTSEGTDWIPRAIPEELYKEIKANKEMFDPALVGFVGYGCSFGGGFFEGYARNPLNRKTCVIESILSIEKVLLKLRGMEIYNTTYNKCPIPKESIIYCDPPYINTKEYRFKFNHTDFYTWCREKKQEGHQIFISEFKMPEDFICIWEKPRQITIDIGNRSIVKVEKLFTL